MVSQPKRTTRFSRPWKSYWRGRRKTRSIARLALETLEDRLAPAGTVHFAVIGDYGLAGPNEQAVANLVKSWNPDFIITTGDNNYPNGEASTIDTNIGQFFHEFIYPYVGTYGAGATSNRFFPCIGNHEWPFGVSYLAPYLAYFALPNNERYYSFRAGPAEFFATVSDQQE